MRRGPLTAAAAPATPLDLAFKVGVAGVMLAAVVLGVALGFARPSWALAAAMLAVGALLAAVVVFRPFSGRVGASTSLS